MLEVEGEMLAGRAPEPTVSGIGRTEVCREGGGMGTRKGWVGGAGIGSGRERGSSDWSQWFSFSNRRGCGSVAWQQCLTDFREGRRK